MDDTVVVALLISAVGLSLLFVALLLLYGLMVALTAVARDRVPSPGPTTPAPAGPAPAGDDQVRRAQAAVVAVALARAEREQRAAVPPEPVGGWSPWRQFHAQRLLGRGAGKRGSR